MILYEGGGPVSEIQPHIDNIYDENEDINKWYARSSGAIHSTAGPVEAALFGPLLFRALNIALPYTTEAGVNTASPLWKLPGQLAAEGVGAARAYLADPVMRYGMGALAGSTLGHHGELIYDHVNNANVSGALYPPSRKDIGLE